MSWTYRVMRKVEGRTTKYYDYGIHEVYTEPKGWTRDAVGPHGETLAELKRDLTAMRKALTLPVLDWDTGKEIKGGGE